MKPFVESKLKIENNPPEQIPEPEYPLEKWPPEHSQVSNKSSEQILPKVSTLPRYIVEKEITVRKPVTGLNNQVKRLKDQTPIKAFNL